MADSSSRPDVLIEQWLPVQELGIESRRERSASSALPPLYFLHVWWARRPLTVSRAAILAALLPPDTDHTWFLRTLGIFGEPVAAYQRILEARASGERIKNPYGHKRAFTYTPDAGNLQDIGRVIAEHWGRERLVFLDPMAGGGSIPFEAMRYGLDTWANELNPVACVILKATLEYPAYFGEDLLEDIRHWAGEVHKRAKEELERFYPRLPGEEVLVYVWAHTVTCPGCGMEVPLSPNWWLERGERRIAARPVVHGDAVSFEIVQDPQANGFDPNDGTVSRGIGVCPGCRNTIAGDAIKSQAQSGQMGYQLVALVTKRNRDRVYRLPGRADLEGVEVAEAYLREQRPQLAALGLIPDEERFIGPADRSANYGITLWWHAFTPRQLLSHLVHLKHIREVSAQMHQEFNAESDDEGRRRWQAVMAYLAVILDKALSCNSRHCRWDPGRPKITNTFERHDFGFRWSCAEWNPYAQGLGHEWSIEQILEAYEDLAKLGAPYRIFAQGDDGAPEINVTRGNAATYYELEDASVDVIVVDPPYYDNVMYAECSDFFYVWQKRALGDVFPEFFSSELADKQQEAVANVALFRDQKGARELAGRDYEDKMSAAFRRMHGLLRDDGVMVVMFTHKQTEAWDALATALIEGGWEITASWPVHTESEHSLHQAKKNAARSTILLVCRKRDEGNEGGWWQETRGEIVRQVKERVSEYEALGIWGVDLMLSAFGPALQVICRHWPVRLPSGETISPEYALDLAREVVRSHRWVQLVGERPVEVDEPSQFVIYAWDFYKAEQIRFDEARKLYMGLGVDLEELRGRKLVERKGEYVTLLTPEQRLRKNGFDPEAERFETTIDALHAAMWWFGEGGLAAVRRFLERTKLNEDGQFLAGMQAYLRALPAVRDEFRALREIAEGLLHGRIEVPEETGQLEMEL